MAWLLTAVRGVARRRCRFGKFTHNHVVRVLHMASYPAFSCPGHGQPCETRSVTKAGSPHLGRPFYVCTASPQCKGWFQFADEPVRQPGKPLASDPLARQFPPACLVTYSITRRALPGKRVALSIGTDVVVSACTVCTDGGETQQQVQLTLTAVPHPDPDPLHTRFLFP